MECTKKKGEWSLNILELERITELKKKEGSKNGGRGKKQGASREGKKMERKQWMNEWINKAEKEVKRKKNILKLWLKRKRITQKKKKSSGRRVDWIKENSSDWRYWEWIPKRGKGMVNNNNNNESQLFITILHRCDHQLSLALKSQRNSEEALSTTKLEREFCWVCEWVRCRRALVVGGSWGDVSWRIWSGKNWDTEREEN